MGVILFGFESVDFSTCRWTDIDHYDVCRFFVGVADVPGSLGMGVGLGVLFGGWYAGVIVLESDYIIFA